MAGIVIYLDTNVLILGMVPGSRESKDLIAGAQTGEIFIAPMPSWPVPSLRQITGLPSMPSCRMG